MKLFTIIIATILSIFSTAVMSYVSMAIPVGPWIAPTLALLAILLFSFVCKKGSSISKEVVLVTVAGSVGGILATSLGFYFTTLNFLDAQLFADFMARPFYFSCVVGVISIIAGAFGIWIANIFEHRLLVKESLAFPVSQLVHKIITAQKTARKSIELLVGFVSNLFFCFLRDGLGSFTGIIPKSITIISQNTISVLQVPVLRIPAITFDLWPMLWALGFVTGHVVAVPLLVGMMSKIFLVEPMYMLAFKNISWMEYIITFCSGMVVSMALFSFFKTPKDLFIAIKKLFKKSSHASMFEHEFGSHQKNLVSSQRDEGGDKGVKVESSQYQVEPGVPLYKKRNKKTWFLETVCLFLFMVTFFTYYKFSFFSQLYIFFFTFICVYQVMVIAGEIGLAPMGKFATFVMVPAMFLFSIDNIQIVLIATFVGLACGVAADILFGRKLARMLHISHTQVKRYQYLGLLVSALCAGLIFWLLITQFGLGSEQLFVLRAQNRWMLINTLKNASSFNYYVMFLGVLFGFILSKAKVSPLLVLGGLFMPINITLGLVIGGLGALLVRHKEEVYPFWSGVYTAGSIWMLIRAML